MQIEDAEKRQALLMNIMQRELNHTKRLKQLKDKENADIENKCKQRETRVQSARVKQYYDEYATRMRSSMLKNKTKEEQVECPLLVAVHIMDESLILTVNFNKFDCD